MKYGFPLGPIPIHPHPFSKSPFSKSRPTEAFHSSQCIRSGQIRDCKAKPTLKVCFEFFKTCFSEPACSLRMHEKALEKGRGGCFSSSLAAAQWDADTGSWQAIVPQSHKYRGRSTSNIFPWACCATLRTKVLNSEPLPSLTVPWGSGEGLAMERKK